MILTKAGIAIVPGRISAARIFIPGSWKHSSSSSSLQTSTDLHKANSVTVPNTLYSFLPETRNPNNMVKLICLSLKGRDHGQLALLQKQGLFSHFTSQKFSRILLRCQSDSSTALTFFQWVKNSLGQKPDVENYCILIHILVWSKNLKQAMKILLELVELKGDIDGSRKKLDVFRSLLSCTNECNWNSVVFDMLIKAYLKKGLVKEGLRAFRKTVKLGYVPSVVTFNCLLNGLSAISCGDKCWGIYEEMVRLGVHPNTCTFNILTHLFCKEGNMDKVNEFLEKMEEEGFEPDVVTYNMLIDSHCKKGSLKDAVYLYNIMYRRGVVPDLVTFTVLVRGLCKAGNMREAHHLFTLMTHRGLKPDAFSYNTLIYGYCKEGMMQEARSLLLDMIETGISPSDFNFSCWLLVKGYHGQGNLISAVNLVVALFRFGVIIPPDVVNYLIIALCKENRPFAVKTLLERVSQDGYEPNEEIYNELINSFCRSNCVEEALAVKVEMLSKNFRPKSGAYGAIIRVLNNVVEAKSLMQEMVKYGFPLDLEICRALINKEGDPHEAESLLSFFAENFQIFDAECYNAVVKLLSDRGETAQLMEFQSKMMKMGYKPNINSCRYILNGMWKSHNSNFLVA